MLFVMIGESLILEKRGNILLMTINNESSLNALNTDLLLEMEKVFDELEEEISVVVISGVGRAFVAGADIAEMVDKNYSQAEVYSLLGCRVFKKIENSTAVVIAAVNGYALGGGCELAMSCDLRIASSNAKFGQPEINLGIIPGFGGISRLVRLVGQTKAKELIYSGKLLTAEEAFLHGLVNEVVEIENLERRVLEIANEIAAKPRKALQIAKRAINTIEHIDDLYISRCFAECFSYSEQKVLMRKFLESR